MKKLVVANWKMYVEDKASASRWLSKVSRANPDAKGSGPRPKRRGKLNIEVWVAAPVVFIKKSSLPMGAQTVSQFENGAHTGELSAAVLKEAGAKFAIVGHSERRAMGENNDAVHAQLVQATHAGLTPLLCVGEGERTAEGAHFTFIEEQLTSALRGMQSIVEKLVVAYEPVWAIGKSASEAMKPQEVEETVIFIRKVLSDVLGREPARKVRVLYGGSVEGENAHTLLHDGGVNGFLVGHASATPESFIEILKETGRLSKDVKAA